MPLSDIVPIVDIDFTNPVQSNAVTGIDFIPPGNVDLSTYYPGIPPLYFARTDGCKSTKVYIDQGLVLESESNSTKQLENFAFGLELPAGMHDHRIHILVQFDVAEVLLANQPNRPFVGAVAAVATETPMKTGKMGYQDRLSPGTCQLRHDAGPPKNMNFRLNAPNSTGGGTFKFTPFDFFRHTFGKPIPPTSDQLAFANNSTLPLELENTITASDDPGTKATVEVNLSQHDASAIKYFAHAVGPNRFESTIYTNSLGSLAFAGVGLGITRPQGVDPNEETNPGPIRVRIRKLGIYYE